MKSYMKELKMFLLLWSTQSLSQLGSAMTNFALVIWLYQKTGSALQTALLSICSYAPYVLMSIFAGALSDRWNKKKVMLICDTLAAICTIVVFILFKNDLLLPWHMYLLNAINGLMNTVQQPAGDVAMTLITPTKFYQKASGMRSFSNSIITILTPMLASMLLSFFGMPIVIGIDLFTFIVAFMTLLLFIKIPQDDIKAAIYEKKETVLQSAMGGLRYLRDNKLIFELILFLAGVNLVASGADATLPALILPRENGGEIMLGIVNAVAGIATLIGSVFVTIMPTPKNRIRVIYITMLISLSIGNFIFAFGHNVIFWCIGQAIGWLLVPVMGANLDVILRTSIPTDMQGRVFSCRNTFQFFTIPVGFFLGGFLIDSFLEPLMERAQEGGVLTTLFDSGKGAGANLMMFILAVEGTVICLIFGRILKKESYIEKNKMV